MRSKCRFLTIAICLSMLLSGCGNGIYTSGGDGYTEIDFIDGVSFELVSSVVRNATAVTNISSDMSFEGDQTYLYKEQGTEYFLFCINAIVCIAQKGTSFGFQNADNKKDALESASVCGVWFDCPTKKLQYKDSDKNGVYKIIAQATAQVAITPELYNDFAGDLAVIANGTDEWALFVGSIGTAYDDLSEETADVLEYMAGSLTLYENGIEETAEETAPAVAIGGEYDTDGAEEEAEEDEAVSLTDDGTYNPEKYSHFTYTLPDGYELQASDFTKDGSQYGREYAVYDYNGGDGSSGMLYLTLTNADTADNFCQVIEETYSDYVRDEYMTGDVKYYHYYSNDLGSSEDGESIYKSLYVAEYDTYLVDVEFIEIAAQDLDAVSEKQQAFVASIAVKQTESDAETGDEAMETESIEDPGAEETETVEESVEEEETENIEVIVEEPETAAEEEPPEPEEVIEPETEEEPVEEVEVRDAQADKATINGAALMFADYISAYVEQKTAQEVRPSSDTINVLTKSNQAETKFDDNMVYTVDIYDMLPVGKKGYATLFGTTQGQTAVITLTEVLTGQEAIDLIKQACADGTVRYAYFEAPDGCSWHAAHYYVESDSVGYANAKLRGVDGENLRFRGIEYTQRTYDIKVSDSEFYSYYAVPNGCSEYCLEIGEGTIDNDNSVLSAYYIIQN